MRPITRAVLAAASSLTALAIASPAWADASAWVYVGGGALAWKPGTGTATGTTTAADGTTITTTTVVPNKFAASGTMVMDVGVGTSPDGRFIVGGLFRLQPIFGHGPDLSALARFATHGFQAGDFGFAIDAGGYMRFWGVSSGGFAGGVTLGAPLGVTLALQSEVGNNGALAFGGTLGIDVLRLTIFRQTLLDGWPNPSPAWHKKRTAKNAITSW